MSRQLAADAAYYRECADDCRRLKAAIEREGRDTNQAEVLDALDRDARLWSLLADEIDTHINTGTEPALFDHEAAS